MSPEEAAKIQASAPEAGELRLLDALRREIDRVGSFDRLMHVLMRVVQPHFGAHAGIAVPVILAIAMVELLRFSVYILIGVVLFSAVLSWVNPHAPLAPLFNNLSRPFLRPFQRLIPPIAGVDLTPLVLLLVLQIVLMLLAWLRVQLIPLIA